MKKLALAVSMVCAAMLLGSCGQSGDIVFEPNFQIVCKHANGNAMYYLKDVETDIMYVYHHDYSLAGLSAYYDVDGKPMTYERFQEVHMKKYHNS